jgi:pimeloyl-ACP methyl ester carboxylesterase
MSILNTGCLIRLLNKAFLSFGVGCFLTLNQLVLEAQETRITLPIVNGHYDVKPLESRLKLDREGNQVHDWRPLTPQSRVALFLLKTQGVMVDFRIEPDRIEIVLDASAKREVSRALAPPSLLNVENVVGRSRLAIYIHGLEGGESTFSALAAMLEREGWGPLKFVYPNDGPINFAADALKEELTQLRKKNSKARLIVVAHSFGGLVGWKAISETAGVNVSDFIALGVPFRGSKLAEYHSKLELLELFSQLFKGRFSALDVLSDGDGEAVEALLPMSDVRDTILKVALPSTTRLHIIAGDDAPIPAEDRKDVLDMLDQLTRKRSLSSSFESELRGLLSSREVIKGEGDGAVSLESATWPSVFESKRIFHRSHGGLLKVNGVDDDLLAWIKQLIR